VVGGLKLTTSEAVVPQRLAIHPLSLGPGARAALQARLALYDTGRTRVARGILRKVMGRYVSRDPGILRALDETRALAAQVAAALEAGDLDAVGGLMARQWECNRVLDPASSDPGLDALFEAMAPHVAGAKLTGAGGGGFMLAMLREGGLTAEACARRMGRLAQARLHELEINEEGLRVEVVDLA